ncbi:5730_t:CDS:2, partial [Dentiscutata erythropus]
RDVQVPCLGLKSCPYFKEFQRLARILLLMTDMLDISAKYFEKHDEYYDSFPLILTSFFNRLIESIEKRKYKPFVRGRYGLPIPWLLYVKSLN